MGSESPDCAPLIAWINACRVHSPPLVSERDLADGNALAQLLHYFLPERFSGRADPADLRGALDAHFHGKLTQLLPAQSIGPAALAEACLFAAIDSPRKDEAIAAILTLGEADQAAIKAALQRVMAKVAAATVPTTPPAAASASGGISTAALHSAATETGQGPRGGGYLARRRGRAGEKSNARGHSRQRLGASKSPVLSAAGGSQPQSCSGRGSGIPSPGASSGVGSMSQPRHSGPTGTAATARLWSEARQLKVQLAAAIEAQSDAIHSEQATREQLSTVLSDLNDEEHAAAEGRRNLSVFWRTKGELIRQGPEEVRQMDEELREAHVEAEACAQRAPELQRRLEHERQRCGAAHLQAGLLKGQLQNLQSERGDPDAGLRMEVQALQRRDGELQQEVRELRSAELMQQECAERLCLQICQAERSAQQRQESLSEAVRELHTEESAKKDATDMIAFRQQQLQDLEDAVVGFQEEEPQELFMLSPRPSTGTVASAGSAEAKALAAELARTWRRQREVEKARSQVFAEERAARATEELLENRLLGASGDGSCGQPLSPAEASELCAARAAARTERALVAKLKARLREEDQRLPGGGAAGGTEAARLTNSDVPGAAEAIGAAVVAASAKPMRPPTAIQMPAAGAEQNAKLVRLRQDLWDRETQLRNLMGQVSRRRRAMRDEVAMIQGALHEIALRCHQMDTAHQAASEAPPAGCASAVR